LTFQKLLKKDEKAEASGGGDTVHKHTATSSAKNGKRVLDGGLTLMFFY
jgi:hypothetical protein